jgi:hypothetical protein
MGLTEILFKLLQNMKKKNDTGLPSSVLFKKKTDFGPEPQRL